MAAGRILLLIIATVLVAIWIALALKYAETYESITASIDAEKYRYPELFCVGFAIMNFLKINTKSKKHENELRRSLRFRERSFQNIIITLSMEQNGPTALQSLFCLQFWEPWVILRLHCFLDWYWLFC